MLTAPSNRLTDRFAGCTLSRFHHDTSFIPPSLNLTETEWSTQISQLLQWHDNWYLGVLCFRMNDESINDSVGSVDSVDDSTNCPGPTQERAASIQMWDDPTKVEYHFMMTGIDILWQWQWYEIRSLHYQDGLRGQECWWRTAAYFVLRKLALTKTWCIGDARTPSHWGVLPERPLRSRRRRWLRRMARSLWSRDTSWWPYQHLR